MRRGRRSTTWSSSRSTDRRSGRGARLLSVCQRPEQPQRRGGDRRVSFAKSPPDHGSSSSARARRGPTRIAPTFRDQVRIRRHGKATQICVNRRCGPVNVSGPLSSREGVHHADASRPVAASSAGQALRWLSNLRLARRNTIPPSRDIHGRPDRAHNHVWLIDCHNVTGPFGNDLTPAFR
jgi:hypothetical protein